MLPVAIRPGWCPPWLRPYPEPSPPTVAQARVICAAVREAGTRYGARVAGWRRRVLAAARVLVASLLAAWRLRLRLVRSRPVRLPRPVPVPMPCRPRPSPARVQLAARAP